MTRLVSNVKVSLSNRLSAAIDLDLEGEIEEGKLTILYVQEVFNLFIK